MNSRVVRPLALLSIQSRECSRELLERLSGGTLFPERLIGSAIVDVVRRRGGSLAYVTAPAMVDLDAQVRYFLNLLPADTPGEVEAARGRVNVISLEDTSARWLSEKFLDTDTTDAAQAREAVRDFIVRERLRGSEVQLSYFEPSADLELVAAELAVHGDQADSAHIPLGTKAASRDLCAEVGIPVPAGTAPCYTLPELADGVANLIERGHRKVVLKLNSTEYAAGFGNALLDLRSLDHSGDRAKLRRWVLSLLPAAEPVDRKIGWSEFAVAIEHSGVIAEQLVEGNDPSSPSFQGEITEDGDVRTISTHDQVLVGPRQTYVGCAFPAAAQYRDYVVESGLRVGRALRERGVRRGDYGVDFMAVREDDGWRVLGCEINLRATGTKHGFRMATALLGVLPDGSGRLFVDGAERVYEASDSIADARYVGLRPVQLIDLVRESGIGYDHERKVGLVLHMLSAVHAHGKFGATAIGLDHAHARRMIVELQSLVDRLVDAGR